MIETNIVPKVEFLFTPIVNYALQQNRLPVIRKLFIENNSEEDLANITVQISSEPEFANHWEHRIDVIPSHQAVAIEGQEFRLSSRYLSQLTEKITGEINLTIIQGEEVIFSGGYVLDVLAYDEWSGIRIMPEILASFETPNHPVLSKVLKPASAILGSWTGDPSFNAYQSKNPDRVKKQMAAIYEAVTALEIVYCTPPASFEQEGQRIRMCDAIFSQKLGTCLDMALFYGGCLEAVGLNPVIIINKGHAFAGCWLVDQFFPDSVNDDISLLKKRIASGINEIVLVETTTMNAGKAILFDEAVNIANHHLVNDDDFILFIDIKRARLSGINPLPQRIMTSDGWEIVEQPLDTRIVVAPEEIFPDRLILPGQEQTFTKQKLWERKLLDLSLRNNLLNLRITRSTIQLIPVSLNLFEDSLADGAEFQIIPKPAEWENARAVSGVYQVVGMHDPIVGLLKDDLKHNRLRSFLNEAELSQAVTILYRSSRLSLEENGANTLYFALGFLKWYETPRSEVARYAPLLLLPAELIRKSARIGYVVRSREEDPLVNITLLEMLRQDFGITIPGLDELPRDASGIDVKKIFSIVRHGIMAQPRWDVEEQAVLGIFSFNKFIMWNDIHNNAAGLTENKIVASLMSGKIEWDVSDFNDEQPELDNAFSPADVVLPISADSSQLEAIVSAIQDKSFILHGPPGTGKSQTITNIIANALYHGKRVLFVAEKMAALSVVQKRLAGIGLDPFCLELHSNKAKKTSVLEQLQKAAEVIRKSSPLEYREEAARLHDLRMELNHYVESLHQKYPFGFSLFDCFNGFARLGSTSGSVVFDELFLPELTPEKYSVYTDIAEELQHAGTLCGHPHNHPLADICTTNYSQSVKVQTSVLIQTYLEILDRFTKLRNEIIRQFNIEVPVINKEQDLGLSKLAHLLLTLPDTPGAMLQTGNVEQVMSQITELAGHGIKRDKYRKDLLQEFKKEVLLYDADSALIQWKIASGKWVLPRWLHQNKFLKSLKLLSKSGKIDREKAIKYFEQVIVYQQEQDILDDNTGFLSRMLEFLWKDGNSDWCRVIDICESITIINHALVSIVNKPLSVMEMRSWLATQVADGAETFRSIYGESLQSYVDGYNQVKKAEQELNQLLEIDFDNSFPLTGDWIPFQEQKARRWIDNMDDLRDWTSWNRAVNKAVGVGLMPLVSSYRDGKIINEEVVDTFQKEIYRLGAEYIISEDNSLSEFNGKLFETKIRKYNEKNKYFQELTRAEIYARLASAVPSFTQEAAQNSETGILQRAIRNKARGMSVRKLFDSIPYLLPRLCPCMLMSPISVAQYFDVGQTKFDLVIFDEASQLPTCEAVGAIARGANMVVVGDPKQMPPTSFFTSNKYDEENAEQEDLESILDDCLALSIPSKHLLWHYRSKHESLIAFSNSNYYDNKLMTFPSPDDQETKVVNIEVPGFYDRGKTRQNKFEAKAIVADIIQRLADPVLSQRSIGIVTFSSVQQNLIEDLLNEALKQNPELETVAMKMSEPVFIKNLENVQGDERDVIMFSMGYGPDKDGRISLNFGPLNREGGWRRLNVAVSRARYEMKVFSTLRSEQIDITRTTSEGVAGIKAFLEYSEKGKVVLSQKNYIRKSTPDSFEKMIAREIGKLGYTVHVNIGCSGYKVDLGVVNPEKPEEYILGIITDGENYRSARTARDREIIRMDVLRLLGWNIYKLWSPDWWDNSQRVLQDIVSVIEEAGKPQPDLKVVKEDVPVARPDTLSKQLQYAGVRIQGITQHVIEPVQKYEPYKICRLAERNLPSSDHFFEEMYKSKIRSQIEEVIVTEAPISQTLLSRRVLNAWGISRLGVRLTEYLNTLYSKLYVKRTFQNGQPFIWSVDQEPMRYRKFRIPTDDKSKRNADDLPAEEVAAAIVNILVNQVSLPKDDLVRETARLFGYSRIGGNVEQAMNTGIDYAVKNKMIAESNSRFIVG